MVFVHVRDWTPWLVLFSLLSGSGCGDELPADYPNAEGDTGTPDGSTLEDSDDGGGTQDDRGDEGPSETGSTDSPPGGDSNDADEGGSDFGESESGSGSGGEEGDAGDDPGDESGDGTGDSADGTGDSGDSDGSGESGDGDDPTAWTFDDVHGVPNLDDDDENGTPDWDDPRFDGDNDLATLILPAATLERVEAGGEVVLALAEDSSAILRVWLDDTVVLGGGATSLDYRFEPPDEDVTFWVEFSDYRVATEVDIQNVDSNGAVVEGTTISLQAAPLLLNHHLQPSEHVWAVELGTSNQSMIQDYRDALGDRFTAVAGNTVDDDPWMQDELEFATATGDDLRLDIVINSIRDRGLDAFARSLVAPDFIGPTWGERGRQTTYDSFGNLETSPPVEVGGQTYPFGRIYYGRKDGTGLNETLAAFLAAQELQNPFEVDTLWLCVGHVDEISAFIPDPGSPKGFKLMFSDVPSAYDILESLAPSTSIDRYAADHGYSTVGDLVDDAGLRALNEDLQADYLTPILEQFKAELGLTDDDVILVPSLFETVCSSRVAALIPGMVNLVVVNFAGESPHLFVADPFFRPAGTEPSQDPFLAAFEASLPDGVGATFLDNWNAYHLRMGEVHCGTNVRRTPIAGWWESLPGQRGDR